MNKIEIVLVADNGTSAPIIVSSHYINHEMGYVIFDDTLDELKLFICEDRNDADGTHSWQVSTAATRRSLENLADNDNLAELLQAIKDGDTGLYYVVESLLDEEVETCCEVLTVDDWISYHYTLDINPAAAVEAGSIEAYTKKLLLEDEIDSPHSEMVSTILDFEKTPERGVAEKLAKLLNEIDSDELSDIDRQCIALLIDFNKSLYNYLKTK